ncbi:unnamed protein product [Polarella glacialis]|uniref:Uncharacterized protein n=1 Tax=Polarella glacialis TaxID=89957 RepID=A0A813KMW8_POLGL|nr:unnamed protein product [Polarella glacialis]
MFRVSCWPRVFVLGVVLPKTGRKSDTPVEIWLAITMSASYFRSYWEARRKKSQPRYTARYLSDVFFCKKRKDRQPSAAIGSHRPPSADIGPHRPISPDIFQMCFAKKIGRHRPK